MMRSIIDQVKQSEQYRCRPEPMVYSEQWASDNATARAAATLSRHVDLKALVVLASGPEWLDLLADYRPQAPVLAFVNEVKLARRLALQWGMIPRVVSFPRSQQELIEMSQAAAVTMLGAKYGDDIAILGPCLPQQLGRTLTLWKIA